MRQITLHSLWYFSFTWKSQNFYIKYNFLIAKTELNWLQFLTLSFKFIL